MNNKLFQLNSDVCNEFLRDEFHNWGFLVSAMAIRRNSKIGAYFTIAPPELNDHELYDFPTAKGMNTYTPYSRDVVQAIVQQLVKKNGHVMVIEDNTNIVGAPYVLNSDREYQVIDDRLYYVMSKESKHPIDDYFWWGTGYGFMPILFENSLSAADILVSIKNGQVSQLVEHAIMFFTPIYDNESYLIWARSDFEHYITLDQ